MLIHLFKKFNLSPDWVSVEFCGVSLNHMRAKKTQMVTDTDLSSSSLIYCDSSSLSSLFHREKILQCEKRNGVIVLDSVSPKHDQRNGIYFYFRLGRSDWNFSRKSNNGDMRMTECRTTAGLMHAYITYMCACMESNHQDGLCEIFFSKKEGK